MVRARDASNFGLLTKGLEATDHDRAPLTGGRNHRLNLAAMMLLKENHTAAPGGVTNAIDAVRHGIARTGQEVEADVEAQTVAQTVDALDTVARWIMLDHMPVAETEIVARIRDRAPDASLILPEASRTFRPDRVRAIAGTGVDLISVDVESKRARAGPYDADDQPAPMPKVVVIDACQGQGRSGSPTAVLGEGAFTSGYQHQRLSAVRCLTRYCRALGMDVDVPTTRALNAGKNRRRPHIYSQAEVDALIDACYRVFSHPLVQTTMAHLIALLAVTGIRPGEALRLRAGDLDAGAATLLIQANKHGPDRLIPLDPTTIKALTSYQSDPYR